MIVWYDWDNLFQIRRCSVKNMYQGLVHPPGQSDAEVEARGIRLTRGMHQSEVQIVHTMSEDLFKIVILVQITVRQLSYAQIIQGGADVRCIPPG